MITFCYMQIISLTKSDQISWYGTVITYEKNPPLLWECNNLGESEIRVDQFSNSCKYNPHSGYRIYCHSNYCNENHTPRWSSCSNWWWLLCKKCNSVLMVI